MLAPLALQKQHYDIAIREYFYLLEQEPENIYHKRDLANLLYSRKMYAEALELFASLINTKLDSAKIRSKLIEQALQAQKLEQAEELILSCLNKYKQKT